MFNYKIQKLPKNSYEILVTIPFKNISEEYKKTFDKVQRELQVEGFRKGKVPKTIAEKHLKKEDIYQELAKDLLPKIYQDLINKEQLQPVINPKIEMIKVKENEDWQIKISIAVRPSIDLMDYKTYLHEAIIKAKKADIWIPGKSKETKPNEEENKQKILNQVLNVLLTKIKIELSHLIIEEELNRRLTELLDDIKKIGLTVEGYLKSKNLTMDELKKRFSQEIGDTYKLEFILQEIADKEGIKVEKPDLDKLFSTISDEKQRKTAEQNAYFYASVLRKQKTLDFLVSL